MAITGELKDINLVTLVQMLCMEHRPSVLTLTRKDGSHGLIAFDNGQVVHAETDMLVGDSAVYHLLSWSDASFQTSELHTTPDHTITTSWEHLLMEGMRMLDEQEHPINQLESEELSPSDIEQDETLEDDVVLLLSKLEQRQADLRKKKVQNRPTKALDVLTTLVNEVVGFFNRLAPEEPEIINLESTVAAIGQEYTALRLLRVKADEISSDIVLKLYNGWTGNHSERRQAFLEISLGMLTVLERYTDCIVELFRLPARENQWRKTCNIFISELKNDIQHIRF